MSVRASSGLAAIGMLLAVLLAGCTALSGGDAPERVSAAPPAQVAAPSWRIGSEWTYSDGYGLKVARVDGPLTRFDRLDDPRQWIVRQGFLRESSQSGTTERTLLFQDLPQGAGLVLSSKTPLTYRREYLADGVTRTHNTSWTVEGRERVKVPAGEFDCVILVMRTRSVTGDWSGYERWWFSPQAQNYVRMEYRYGPGAGGSRVLMRYTLAGG